MRKKLISLFIALSLMGLAMPMTAMAQRNERGSKFIKRGKNGIKIGDSAITLFDGPGIVNYEHRHRWMDSPGGAATVIGIGAGAGAVTGGVIKGKKGAVIGAIVGAGAATGVWLYKNRRHKHRIF